MEDRSESDVQLLLSAREVFSVDDLCTGRGVVLGRAATTLRSIETQPFDWMICSCQLDKSSEHQAGLVFLFSKVVHFCC